MKRSIELHLPTIRKRLAQIKYRLNMGISTLNEPPVCTGALGPLREADKQLSALRKYIESKRR